MKKKSLIKVLALASLSFVLSSCDLFVITTSSSEGSKTEDTSHTTSDTTSSDTTSEESLTSDTSLYPTSISEDLKDINLYTVNDFHGAVKESYSGLGLAKFATYFKEKGVEDNTLLLDIGDTWQGSIESNYNDGKMITDVYNHVKFDARVVGNHDFDWGTEALISNTADSYEGYKTPVLAANVYDYDMSTHTTGTTQQSDIGVPSILTTLENGLKVGVVGVIGKKQITSITTSRVENVIFKDHISTIKSEATALREQGADVVIAGIHAGQSDVIGYGLEDYVDVVLCAHTHVQQTYMDNGLLFLQAGAYGECFGNINLKYDPVTKKVVAKNYSLIQADDLRSQITPDEKIQNIINAYLVETTELSNTIYASNVTGEWYSSGALPNLMTRAMREYGEYLGQDFIFAYTNVSRASLYNSVFTYADLFQAFPFANDIYVIEVTGSDLYNEVYNYNYFSRCDDFTTNEIVASHTYRIAVIDHLAFHTNEDRYYNYFPSVQTVSKFDLDYLEILLWYLVKEGYSTGKLLSASDFDTSLFEFNTKNLTIVS